MRLIAVLSAALVLTASATDWKAAVPGWKESFPRDHFIHPDFKTEWWYFTGHLSDEMGKRYGFQLTFFRDGVRPEGERPEGTSRFLVNDLKFAHFTVTDVSSGQFSFQQKLSRGAFGEAGFAPFPAAAPTRLAWIDDWEVKWLGGGSFAIRASSEKAELNIHLTSLKPWVEHGENGVSQKADGIGHASHYYSGTSLAAEGRVTIDGKTSHVSGESWFDREWATNQLAENQAGWNWFCIQLERGAEIMLYQMRRKDGSVDANSSGTFITGNGAAQHLKRDDYVLTPEKIWISPETGGRYPIAWKLSIPRIDFVARISTPVSNQELALDPISYWEGLIDITGTWAGAKADGQGYMELTGYAGALPGLSIR